MGCAVESQDAGFIHQIRKHKISGTALAAGPHNRGSFCTRVERQTVPIRWAIARRSTFFRVSTTEPKGPRLAPSAQFIRPTFAETEPKALASGAPTRDNPPRQMFKPDETDESLEYRRTADFMRRLDQ